MEVGDKRRKRISFSSKIQGVDYYTHYDLEHDIVIIYMNRKTAFKGSLGEFKKFKDNATNANVVKHAYNEMLSMIELLDDALTKYEK